MTAGFLGNPYEKDKDSLVALYENYIGEEVELGVRNMGLIKGQIESIVNYCVLIPDPKGKTHPTVIDIRDISLLNPVSKK